MSSTPTPESITIKARWNQHENLDQKHFYKLKTTLLVSQALDLLA